MIDQADSFSFEDDGIHRLSYTKLEEYSSSFLQELLRHVLQSPVGEKFFYCGHRQQVEDFVGDLLVAKPGSAGVLFDVHFHEDGDFGIHVLCIREIIPALSVELDDETSLNPQCMRSTFSRFRGMLRGLFKNSS